MKTSDYKPVKDLPIKERIKFVISKKYHRVKDLKQSSIYDLFKLNNLTTYDIIELINDLNDLNIHLKNDNIIDYNDYFNDNLIHIFNNIDLLLKKRSNESNNIKIKIYNLKIYLYLMSIKNIKKKGDIYARINRRK